MAKKETFPITINVPANVREILALDAKRHKRTRTKRLLECWMDQLPPEERVLVKGDIGIMRRPTGEIVVKENPHLCKECESVHDNIPGPGPWHKEGCSQFQRRAMWG